MININDNNYQEELTKNPKLLIYIGAKWCGPCRMMAPILEKLSKEFPIAKIDVDDPDCKNIVQGVRSVPTMIFYENGEDTQTFVGLKSEDVLRSLF